jgi:hypothetical protein
MLEGQDEQQLAEQFRLLQSLFRHGHFPTEMDPQPLGSVILSCLTTSSDELLTVSIIQFLDAVFARPETDDFGLFLLRNGICSHCARFFASGSLLPYVLRLFCNIAGGTIEEKSMTEEILPVELIRDLILDPSNEPYFVHLCHLLRIYSHFEMEYSRSVIYFSVFDAIWRNLSHECWLHVLWSIFWHRKSLKSRWATQVTAFHLVELFERSLVIENVDLTIAALTCIVQFLKHGEQFDLNLAFLGELMKSGEPLRMSLSCWAVEKIILLNLQATKLLMESGMVSDILGVFESGCYESKHEAAFCLCGLLKRDPLLFLPIIREEQVVESLIEVMKAELDAKLLLGIIDLFSIVFQIAAGQESEEWLRGAFAANEGKALFEELTFNDDEDVAGAATRFLSEFIDAPYDSPSDDD